ncbi:hypothetical protein HN588_07225 [Candidatus Bathyarchaeota archaeon]|nr:hypothetical protein [Candidatus Bathyarchaeota archaeon]
MSNRTKGTDMEIKLEAMRLNKGKLGKCSDCQVQRMVKAIRPPKRQYLRRCS